MQQFLSDHWLDILGTITGLVYIYQEYKASVYLWLTGIIMPVIYIFVYLDAHLYADFGMQVYYVLAAVYGFLAWQWNKFSNKGEGPRPAEDLPITHMPLRAVIPAAVVFIVMWIGIYYILILFTNSTVPVLDSFGNALSIIGLWALARKYVEQWLIWIVADIELSALYVYKDIPFTAILYALYVVIAIAGYRKWIQIMKKENLTA